MDAKISSMLYGRVVMLDRPLAPSNAYSKQDIMQVQNTQNIAVARLPGMTNIFSSTLPTPASTRIVKGAIIPVPMTTSEIMNLPPITWLGN